VSPTFAQLVAEVAAKTQLTKLSTRRVLETFFGELAAATWATGRVRIPGLGSFRTRARRPRSVLDPEKPSADGYTPRRVRELAAHRVVVCRVAKSWRRRDV
jgi:nucleoid DNA-binding protein